MTSDTAPPSEVDAIHARHIERARRIAEVFFDAAAPLQLEDRSPVVLWLSAVFQAAADLLHEEADAAAETRKRGHQSLAKDLRNAAGRIVGLGQDLAELAKLEVHSVQLHVPSGDADGSDPSAAERLASLPTGALTLTAGEASAQFFADRVQIPDEALVDKYMWGLLDPALDQVRDGVATYLAGGPDVMPPDAPKGIAVPAPIVLDEDRVLSLDQMREAAVAMIVQPYTATDERGMDVQPTAPHLAFEDPSPIARQFMREPFPGANEHRWTFADLMRPVDPAELPDHWSWSQLTSAEDCGVQHRLSRLERVPQQPQWANIGGGAFHAVSDAFDRGAYAAGGADLMPEADPELVQNRWEGAFAAEIASVAAKTGIEMGAEGTNYRASRGGRENYTWWLIEGAQMLATYLATRRKLDRAGREADTLAEPLALQDPNGPPGQLAPVIEWAYTRRLPGPAGVLPVHGVIDRAYRCADGSIMIKDLKTGAGQPDTGQLGEYAWGLLYLLYGAYPSIGQPVETRIRGCFYDARKGLFSEPIDLLGRPHHPHEEYVYRYHTAQMARSSGLYMPRRSSWCNGCSVKHACPVGPSAVSA